MIITNEHLPFHIPFIIEIIFFFSVTAYVAYSFLMLLFLYLLEE